MVPSPQKKEVLCGEQLFLNMLMFCILKVTCAFIARFYRLLFRFWYSFQYCFISSPPCTPFSYPNPFKNHNQHACFACIFFSNKNQVAVSSVQCSSNIFFGGLNHCKALFILYFLPCSLNHTTACMLRPVQFLFSKTTAW